jgi:hypothetical protein
LLFRCSAVPLFRCSAFSLWGVSAVTALVQGCDSVNVDASTGVCSQPYWVQQQQLFPDLDATSGVAIGVAILICWATAYSFKTLRRVGD